MFSREDYNITNFDFSFEEINEVYWGGSSHSTIL